MQHTPPFLRKQGREQREERLEGEEEQCGQDFKSGMLSAHRGGGIFKLPSKQETERSLKCSQCFQRASPSLLQASPHNQEIWPAQSATSLKARRAKPALVRSEGSPGTAFAPLLHLPHTPFLRVWTDVKAVFCASCHGEDMTQVLGYTGLPPLSAAAG